MAIGTFTDWVDRLRCPGCQSDLSASARAESLHCLRCSEDFPIINGIPRMLLSSMRQALGTGGTTGDEMMQAATAQSFGFEWSRFSEMYREWETNFLEYMQPHTPEFFHRKRVLDAGCGSGRHAYYAAQYGADVWAVDLGPAVEVTRRNTQHSGAVHVVQADLYHLPFAPESFDFIYSIGVLHHLPDPESGFRNLLRYLKPGGEAQIYLYWKPEGQPVKRALLALVTTARHLTMRLPHPVLYALSYPVACAAYAFFILPYQLFSRIPGLAKLAEKMPMKQYARYPFRVCVNDQFDRFSAPIENRYTRAEVEAWLHRAGLEEVIVLPNYGWVASGRKPSSVPIEMVAHSSVSV